MTFNLHEAKLSLIKTLLLLVGVSLACFSQHNSIFSDEVFLFYFFRPFVDSRKIIFFVFFLRLNVMMLASIMEMIFQWNKPRGLMMTDL